MIRQVKTWDYLFPSYSPVGNWMCEGGELENPSPRVLLLVKQAWKVVFLTYVRADFVSALVNTVVWFGFD